MKKLKLFKRSTNPGAPYYVKFQIKNKAYLWSTKTDNPAMAATRARDYRQRALEGAFHLMAAMKSRSGLPTFGQIFAEYDAMPWPNEFTRRRNIASMRMILKESNLADGDGLERLTKDVGMAWQKKKGLNEVTKNSVLRKAKSIFSRKAIYGYKQQIPNQIINDFMMTPSLKEPTKLPQIPSAEAMNAAWDGIARGDLCNAFLLAAYCGLRAGEIAAARWDWLQGDMIYVGGREEFQTKSGQWRVVEVAPDVLDRLTRNDSDMMCGSNATQLVQRALPLVLRSFGITGRNPTHSLRRWYGSQIAGKHGLLAASKALGHSSQKVTEKHYVRQLQVTPGLSPNGRLLSTPSATAPSPASPLPPQS